MIIAAFPAVDNNFIVSQSKTNIFLYLSSRNYQVNILCGKGTPI